MISKPAFIILLIVAMSQIVYCDRGWFHFMFYDNEPEAICPGLYEPDVNIHILPSVSPRGHMTQAELQIAFINKPHAV